MTLRNRCNLARPLRHALAGACLLAPAVAQAQETVDRLLVPPVPPEDPEMQAEQPTMLAHDSAAVYLPADFAQFAPRTALDMLNQIPGFSIQRQSVARGLGQASGNILINGVRFSSKSVSAQDQLSRIPAENVIRIEIVDGAALDIPGLSGRVANVIAESGTLSGRFEWRSQFSTGVAPFRWSQGDISLSGSSGPVEFTVAFENPSFYGGSEGPNLVTDGAGVPDPRINWNKSRMDRPTISGNFGIDLPGSALANLNLSYDRGIFRSNEREWRVDSALPALEEVLRNEGDDYGYEIGGDLDFALGPGRLKLIALESFQHNDFASQAVLSIDNGLPDTGSRFERASDSGERIGRMEYRWPLWGADWQVSFEAAFNRLDNVSSLFLLDPEGEFQEIPFPAGTGGVREDRYEALLTYSRPLTGNLSLQLTAGGENSKIAQTGSNALSREFRRPKGSLNLSWAPGGGLDISFRVERQVGQLNFGDFLANVNLGDSNTNAGNNQLRPPQSWVLELEVAKDFGEWGSAKLTLNDREIEDFITVIPQPGGGESPGNIPSARRYGLDLDGTLQFDPIGFSGAKLDLKLRLEQSSLKDPVTGETRKFDNRRSKQIELDFRHDVPDSDWAWGSEFRATEFTPYYRVSEWGYDYNVDLFGAVFVEHKDVFGLTVRFRAANLFRKEIVLQRTVYDGPRNVAPILYTEDRRREIGGIFNLTVSGSF